MTRAASLPHPPAVAMAPLSVRDVIARVSGETDAAQYQPSGNRPSLVEVAETERMQRVFGMIREGAELYAAKGHAK